MSFHRLGKTKNSWCEDDRRAEDEEKPKDKKVDQEDQEWWRRLQEFWKKSRISCRRVWGRKG